LLKKKDGVQKKANAHECVMYCKWHLVKKEKHMSWNCHRRRIWDSLFCKN
jgi:hypothetical protein